MRFFLLSLVLNLLFLLIPLKSEVQKPRQKIVVSLHVKEKQVKPIPKKVAKPKKQEIKKEYKKIEKKPKIKHKKKPKKVVKKLKKKPKKVKKTKKAKKIVEKKVVKKEIIKPTKSEKKISKEPKIPISKTHNNSLKGKEKRIYCKEGVDFRIIKEPSTKYPKKALRMRIRKVVHVDVYFRVDMSGNIDIIKTNGGSSIFVNEAIKRTKKMEIKLLNKEAIKCKIIKPFRFDP